MVLQIVSALLLIAGLALGVKVALFGVERRRGGVIRRPHAAINSPALAAAMVAWGAFGYGLPRAGVRPLFTIVVASLAGAAAWVGSGTLMAKWALRAPLEDPHELAEILQGHVAIVTKRIDSEPGAVAYSLHGESYVVPARSITEQPIEEGTDVVIDRIEGDMAYVEPWSLVEPRL